MHRRLRLRAVLIATTLCLWVFPATAQEIVGTVTDAATGEPLPGANVFLDQTTLGASSDADGSFAIAGVRPGSYLLVVSMVGYAPQTRSVEVVPETPRYRADFELEPTVLELEGVEVEGERPRRWEKDLRHFEQFFVGTSENAEQTEILNPYVLDFKTEDGIFKARASSPLVVENRALGYRITVVIAYFWEVRNTMLFGGPMRFEELEPADAEEAQRWQEAREEAYRGSYMHMLRSLVAGTLREEGFSAEHDIILNKNRLRVEVGAFPILEAAERPYLFHLSFDHKIVVRYGREKSEMRMTRDRATIHEGGYLYGNVVQPPPPLFVAGDMSERRVADMVPRDYGL